MFCLLKMTFEHFCGSISCIVMFVLSISLHPLKKMLDYINDYLRLLDKSKVLTLHYISASQVHTLVQDFALSVQRFIKYLFLWFMLRRHNEEDILLKSGRPWFIHNINVLCCYYDNQLLLICECSIHYIFLIFVNIVWTKNLSNGWYRVQVQCKLRKICLRGHKYWCLNRFPS